MKIKNIDTHAAAFVAPYDLAIYLDVNVRTIYHWIDKGALHALRIERTVRIPIAEARRIVRQHMTEQVTSGRNARDRSDRISATH